MNSSSNRSNPLGASKLGAKKVSSSINFDELERQANTRPLTPPFIMRDTPIEQTTIQNASLSNVSNPSSSPRSVPVATFSPEPMLKRDIGSTTATTTVISKEEEEASERLGMGFRRLQRMNQMASSTTSSPPFSKYNDSNFHRMGEDKNTIHPSSSSSTQRFADAKGISSDQFFSRNEYAATDTVHHDRLKALDGALSISSADYFGMPQDQHASPREFDPLELARKVSNIDYDAVKDVLRQGSSKISQAIHHFQQG